MQLQHFSVQALWVGIVMALATHWLQVVSCPVLSDEKNKLFAEAVLLYVK